MIGQRLKLASAALLVSFVLTSGGGFLLYQSAQAFGLLESLLVKGLVQTIGLKEAEKQDRSNINKRRDQELMDVDLRVKALEVQERNGWISAEDAARERLRYASLSAAIQERAKRERQIVSFQTRNRIRDKWKSTLTDVLKVATGADPRAVDFLVGILRGEKPLTAAVSAAISGGAPVGDPLEQFRDLEATLREAKKAAQGLRGAQGIAIRARIEQALREVSGIAIGDGEVPDDKLSRLKDLEGQLQAVGAKFGDILKSDLFAGSEGISRERFENNERYQQLDAAVQALEGPLVGRVIVSTIMRNAIDEATKLAEEAGLNLTPEQLADVAASVAEMWAGERKAQAAGEDKETTPIEDMVRTAVNQTLATAGQDELATPGNTPVAVAPTQAAASGGGPAAPTATSVATATTQPSPTATRVPTAVPPPPTAQPTATEPPPTATTAPVLTFSGSITEGVAAGSVDSLSSTISLTIDFATGAVSGSISGSGGGNDSIPCSFPNGPTIDTAVIAYSSSYQGTFTGTYDPATGAISGSMSVGGNVTGSLVQPYTDPQCVHLNAGEIPSQGAWSGSGSFSGSVTQSGGTLSTNWTAGSASAGGTASLSP